MKKTIFTTAALLLCLLSYGKVVERTQAEKVAKQFMGAQTVSFVWDGGAAAQTKSAGEAPAFYVFNRVGGGWVIISADDSTCPVLAYSDKGSFKAEGMPANVSAWFSRMEKKVLEARKSAKPANASVASRWAAPLQGTKASTDHLLETASWAQTSPYNNSVNSHLGKSNMCTGCVATAMSIVMRFHQWPQKGKGTIPSYSNSSNGTVKSLKIDGYEYNWSNMPLTYSSSWTSAQKTAVADLMLHSGLSVEMEYGTDGSGAYSSDIIPALVKYFSYKSNVQELYRINYSDQDWFKMIAAEISENRPVIYGGGDLYSDSGHQFILDGYNDDNCVHVNWGWGGLDNGWYAVNYLEDTEGYVFSYYDSGLFNLAPDKDSKPGNQVAELFLYPWDDFVGLSLVSGTIAQGNTFKIRVGDIMNDNFYADYEGSVKLCLLDKDGNIKEDICSPQAISIEHIDDSGNYDYAELESVSCRISGTVALGDYIALFYDDLNGGWLKMGATYDASDSYDIIAATGELGAFDIPMIKVSSTLKAGQYYYPALRAGQKLIKTATWTYDGVTVPSDKLNVKLSSGTHVLKVKVTYDDNTTETIQKTIKVQ